jgi:hypothetical protein
MMINISNIEQAAQYFRFFCDVFHTYRKIHTAYFLTDLRQKGIKKLIARKKSKLLFYEIPIFL